MAMVITVEPDLEAALNDLARRKVMAPEALAVQTLRNCLLPPAVANPSRDDWERLLRSAATDCGVSLSNEALSRDRQYD